MNKPELETLFTELKGKMEKLISTQERTIEYLRQENIDWEDKYRVIVGDNIKLRRFIELKQVCWKHVGFCGNCPYNGVDAEHSNCNCTIQEELDSLKSELNIVVV